MDRMNNKNIDLLKNNKINALDTASLYGNSEQVLGKVGVKDYQVITKTIPLKDSANEVFYKSLENLNQRQVDGLLIHNINPA
jgi:diketogulonate reductase-like aldo/keto reductase